jgi:hypothetical protein
MTERQPFHEPLQRTLARTVGIAVVAGGVLAISQGGLAQWPAASAVMLWPTFGGHWLELWFLNWLRPRLADGRVVQIVARLAVWFVGGVVLAAGMWLTAAALPGLRPPRAAVWWLAVVAGLAFIGLELAVQVILQLRGRPGFFNGRG